MKTPLVTVGIPFYNAGRYLEFAILSVLNQTFTEWKLILIDDGSDDVISNTIAKKYVLIDERIILLADGQNKGLVSRLNELSSLVRTTYYARMDADDIMHPNRLERQVQVLQDNTSLNACGSLAFKVNEFGEIKGQLNSYWPKKRDSILIKNTLIHPSLLFVSTWSLQNPYHHEWIRMEDLELWFRTFDNLKIEIVNEKLLYYRVFSSNTGKYIKTEKYKMRFFYALFSKNQISLSKYIFISTISIGKQVFASLFFYLLFYSNSSVFWEDEIKGLYYLNQIHKSANEKI